LTSHAVRLVETNLSRLFVTGRCASFKRLGFCEICGLRSNEMAFRIKQHVRKCKGFKENRSQIVEVHRGNVFDWWEANKEDLWWASYPNLDVLEPLPQPPQQPPSMTSPVVFTSRYGAGFPPPTERSAWTLTQRWEFEQSNIPFPVAVVMDVMPRTAALEVNRVRLYFEMAPAPGVYAVMCGDNQVCRMIVRGFENDSNALANMTRYDVVEGAMIDNRGPWQIVTGSVSFDRVLWPGNLRVQLGAATQGGQSFRMVVTDRLFLV